MRDFSWKYFALTGDVESYLLYKELDDKQDSIHAEPIGIAEDEQELALEEGSL